MMAVGAAKREYGKSWLKSYESVQRYQALMPMLVEYIRTVKTGDFSSAEYRNAVTEILKMTKNVRQNAFRHMYGYYGIKEFSFENISEAEMMQEINTVIIRSVNRFNLETAPEDAVEFCRNFYKFVGGYAYNEPKRLIEDRNGISHHYACALLKLKKEGLDLWSSPEEDILKVLACVRQRGKVYRDMPNEKLMESAYKMLLKMREMFNNPHEDNGMTKPTEKPKWNEIVSLEKIQEVIQNLQSEQNTKLVSKQRKSSKEKLDNMELACYMMFSGLNRRDICTKFGTTYHRLSCIAEEMEKTPELYNEDVMRKLYQKEYEKEAEAYLKEKARKKEEKKAKKAEIISIKNGLSLAEFIESRKQREEKE